jgi:peptidoglycan/LPS O-acetylase OafA/YrhL
MYSIITLIVFIFIISIFFREGKIEQKILCIEQTQYLKGIAILLIILCHTIGQAKETTIATPLGGIGVAIFLFMSGYGLQESYKKNKLSGFWRKKILRIFVPYTIFITIKCIILADFDFKKYLLDIFFIHTSYWYIGYLIKCYIVFYISSLFNEKHKLLVLALGSMLSLFLLPEIEAEQSFSFIMGVIASIKIKEIRSLSKKGLYIIAVTSIIIGVTALAIKQFTVVRQNEFIYFLCQLLVKLPIAIGIIFLVGKLLPKNSFAILCGTYSLELYLIHMQTLKIIQYNTIQSYIVLLLTFIVTTALFSYIFNLLCKKANNFLT